MGVDPAQREQLRTVLGDFGADPKFFEDTDVDAMWKARYTTRLSLQIATRAGLKNAGLPPAIVDYVLSLQGRAASAAGVGATGAAAGVGTTRAGAAAGLGVGSAAGAETKLYNNVTVFVPGYATPYAKLDYKYLTKNDFVKQMERERYFRVVTVAEQPSQPLALEECTANSVDISEVQLQDDVKLAVVVGAEHALHKVQQQVKTIKGWKEGRINKDEYKAAEWATMHIAGDMGASRWCFKEISGLVDADKLKIEIDGMAFSLERVVLVERKPRIKLMYVQELADKIWKLM